MQRSFFLLCALILSGAMGAGAATTDTARGSFESPITLPDSVVVTANRFGSSDTRSVWPAEVIKIDRPDASVSLDSRLEGQAGLDIRSQSGLGSVATLSNWGVFNRHVLLLYNGRPVKDYSLGGFNLADYSPHELSRIEIVKGPQSAFYGSDAVGGVVNLISPTTLIDRLDARTTFGSFDTRSYAANTSRKLGSFGFGAWAEYTTTDNRRLNSGIERLITGLRSDFLSGAHRLSFTARYFEDSLGVPGPVPEPTDIPAYGSPESSSLFDRQEDQNYSADLQYRHFSKSLGETQIDLFWEKKNLSYHSLYSFLMTFEESIDSIDVRAHTIYNKRSAGINIRHQHDLGPLSLAGGVDWLSGSLRYSNTALSDAFTIAGPDAPSHSISETYSYYDAVQDQADLWGNTRWSIVPPLHLDLSGRMQLVEGRRPQPSYNLGLVFIPESALRLKLAYAYAFRLPSLAEQFADDLYTAGNADLNPETARTLAATVSFDPANAPIDLRITWFHQEIDSLIQYVWNPMIYRSAPRNYHRFTSSGIDASFTARLPYAIDLRNSLVYQEAERSSADDRHMISAPYVPDFKWQTGVTWHNHRVSAGAHITATSERSIYLYDGSQKTIDRVHELSADFGAQLTDYLQLHLTGNDLTDERRADQFGFTSADGDYPGLGRRFFIELSFTMR